MVTYACSRCGDIFEQKQKYDAHMARVRKCKISEEVFERLLKAMAVPVAVPAVVAVAVPAVVAVAEALNEAD